MSSMTESIKAQPKRVFKILLKLVLAFILLVLLCNLIPHMGADLKAALNGLNDFAVGILNVLVDLANVALHFVGYQLPRAHNPF